MKDEFVALVSHELRTPLTSIRGYLELVLDDADQLAPSSASSSRSSTATPTACSASSAICCSSRRPRPGASRFDWAEVELDAAARQCVEAAKPAAEAAGVELGFDARDGPSRSSATAARIAQLARQPRLERDQVHARRRHASTVRVARVGRRRASRSRDTGIGIAAEEQEQLFERFFRTRSATDAAIPGTGLGLSISKAIVDAHGGTIGVESAAGRGTTFRVELPLEQPEE